MMKMIKLKEQIKAEEYFIREYDKLPLQVCLFQDNDANCLKLNCLYKDILSPDDDWKYIILAACSIVGLLDRNKIKALIHWPHEIYVHERQIATISVVSLSSKPGVILTISLDVNHSEQGICMKDITHQYYQCSTLVTGLIAFLNIYDNLYHTQQFYKALDYANDISFFYGKRVKYGSYGVVIFEKLQSNGMLMFRDDKGNNYQKHILEIEENK